MTTRSIQDIARMLEREAHKGPEAFDAAMDALWPDEGVTVGHTPPLPSDGIMHREFVSEAHRRVAQAMRRAMPDFHYENISARIDGDAIYVSYDQTGTTADGSRPSVTVGVRLTFQAGRLNEAVSAFDHEKMAPFIAMMADLPPPDDSGRAVI